MIISSFTGDSYADKNVSQTNKLVIFHEFYLILNEECLNLTKRYIINIELQGKLKKGKVIKCQKQKLSDNETS